MLEKYRVTTDGGEECVIDALSPLDAADQYVFGSEYEESNTTSWVTVRVTSPDGTSNLYRVTIHPDEPECPYGDHNWQLKGTFPSSGGVIIREHCIHCGLRMTTNTWAQDPSDGTEGLESITYEQ